MAWRQEVKPKYTSLGTYTPPQQENQIFAQLVRDAYLCALLAYGLQFALQQNLKYIFQAFATCLFNFGFGLGLGNIFFVLVGEVNHEYFHNLKAM